MKTRLKDILWAVQAPPDVYGWMDWATGILYLNEEVDDVAHWETMLDGSRGAHAQELVQVFTHEAVHFQQIVTMGYLYQWACQFYEKLVAASRPLLSKNQFLAAPSAATLIEVEKAVAQADRDSLYEHLDLLDRAGPNGVSVRDLIEAHAFLIEKKSHWGGLDAVGHVKMMNEGAPGPEYRHAYDLARYRVGEPTAFAYFSLIASMALCTEDPPLAFDIILTEMARSSFPPSPGEEEYARLQQLVHDEVPGILGTSAEVAERTGLTHPVYTVALHAINEACEGGFRILNFFADPPSGVESIAQDVLRPLVFRANTKDEFPIYLPPKMKKEDVFTLLLYSAFASRLLGPRGYEHAGRVGLESYGWLSRVRPDLLHIAVSPDMLKSGDIGVFAKLDPKKMQEPQRSNACALFGRCAVTFDLDGDHIWMRKEVRRFVAAVHKANPAFPMFLTADTAFGMFRFWFGALADPAANQGSALNMTHASVVGPVMESIGAILATTTELGFDGRPVLQAFLTPYPRDMVEELFRQLAA